MNKQFRLFTVLLLLLMAVSLAITQESPGFTEEDEGQADFDAPPLVFENEDEDEGEPEIPPEPLPDWVTPPRWYRSNTGGMMLEEISSRLAAIRNEFALVSDFISREELPDFLLPFFDNHYIEIRVLYRDAKEYRRQWIFRDANGLYRLVAVFRETAEETDKEDNPETAEEQPEYAAAGEDAAADFDSDGSADGSANAAADSSVNGSADAAILSSAGGAVSAEGNGSADAAALNSADDTTGGDAGAEGDVNADISADDNVDENFAANPEEEEIEIAGEDIDGDYHFFDYRNLSGFIEIYGDNLLLEREIVFFGKDNVRETLFTYRKGTLISSEAVQHNQADDRRGVRKIFTDIYRYNRSGSLRMVERTYHEQLDAEKVNIRFANRVLDAAANSMFLSDQLYLSSYFFEDISVKPDQKMVYTTDDRYRILTQSLLDSEGELIWIIKNIWSGDRIVSATKIQDDDEKLNEYEYNSAGDLIVERNLHNGILQRQVFSEGSRETEELFMNGVLVLRAIWENGQKVSEQPVRPGEGRQ